MEALNAYLDSNKLTQTAFAKIAKLKQWEVSRIASGERKATARQAAAIDTATGGEIKLADLRPDLFPQETAA